MTSLSLAFVASALVTGPTWLLVNRGLVEPAMTIGGPFGVLAYLGLGVVVAPGLAGFAGGIAGRRAFAVVGSLAGFVVGVAGAQILLGVGGGEVFPFDTYWLFTVMLLVPVATGHLAALAFRPRRNVLS